MGGQRPFAVYCRCAYELLIIYNIKNITPEEKARIKIDQWFADAGWKVVYRDDYEPTCTAVAIREGLLKGNLEADYFLFINGKAVGVLEAKREETDAFASKVCDQATLYARSVPNVGLLVKIVHKN